MIATQTKADVGGLVIPDRLTDDYFRRARSEKKQGEGSLFTDSKQVLPLRGLETSHIRYTYKPVRCPTQSVQVNLWL